MIETNSQSLSSIHQKVTFPNWHRSRSSCSLIRKDLVTPRKIISAILVDEISAKNIHVRQPAADATTNYKL
jgi:hypothetical protein